ncbi:MAG: hypothetical protein WCF23_22930 [Candidatus Nitrosopolaris sp.]
MTRNIVADVKFTFPIMACSVIAAAWHYECHQPIKEIGKAEGIYHRSSVDRIRFQVLFYLIYVILVSFSVP